MVSELPGFNEKNDIHKRMNHVLKTYSERQLFHLLVQLQTKADSADKLRKENDRMSDENQEARIIIKHWKELHQHLEQNPSLKEEWDNFCLAIKLTEE